MMCLALGIVIKLSSLCCHFPLDSYSYIFSSFYWPLIGSRDPDSESTTLVPVQGHNIYTKRGRGYCFCVA
jgi:hypothetical protein